MSRGADLFVICKSCGAEVSPYITECPYCGTRVRKRAPKLEPGGKPKERKPRHRARPRLGRLRRGEIPGIATDGRPWGTIALVLAGMIGVLIWRIGVVDYGTLVVDGKPVDEWWRVFSAPFAYDSLGYAFVALLAVALFGFLLERRHGTVAVMLLFLSAASVGMLLAATVEAQPLAAGANGGALGLLAAWAVPDLQARRRGEEVESDWIGVLVLAVALLLLPVAVEWANLLAGLGGAVVGLVLGLPLARLQRAG